MSASGRDQRGGGDGARPGRSAAASAATTCPASASRITISNEDDDPPAAFVDCDKGDWAPIVEVGEIDTIRRAPAKPTLTSVRPSVCPSVWLARRLPACPSVRPSVLGHKSAAGTRTIN
jgi:hypothetical protein